MKFEEFKKISLKKLKNYTPKKLPQNGLILAAVAALFYEKNDEAYLLLTKRTDKVATHKKQISFPGGGKDADDKSILETALREVEEEVGISPEDIKIWGESDDFITVTDYWVKPFIGEIPYPYNYKIQKSEIAEIIEVPLELFLSKKYFREEVVTYNKKQFPVYYYSYNAHEVWGATAFMINRMIDIILDYNPSPNPIKIDERIINSIFPK